jgi:hypothetical protein
MFNLSAGWQVFNVQIKKRNTPANGADSAEENILICGICGKLFLSSIVFLIPASFFHSIIVANPIAIGLFCSSFLLVKGKKNQSLCRHTIGHL